MIINGFWMVFACGAFGGGIGELIKWYRLREKKRLPLYAKSLRYWVVTFLMIAVGGVLSALYGIENINAINAVNIGVSAPLIIQGLGQVKSIKQMKQTDNQNELKSSGWGKYLHKERPTLLEFISG